MQKKVWLLLSLVAIMLAVVWSVRAQDPMGLPPPLPDREEIKAPHGATATPKPDEERPNGITAPTVTPIPFKDILYKGDKNLPKEELGEIIVRKADGNYIKIWVSPQFFEEHDGETFHESLELEEEDVGEFFAPPLVTMQRRSRMLKDMP